MARDPDEVMRDYYDGLEAAGICLFCKEHEPCGCNKMPIRQKKKACRNCGSPFSGPGNFCRSKCTAEYIGEV